MYDMILELAHAIWKNGFSLSVIGTLVFLFLKQRRVKKKLHQFIKWLPEDESELRELIINMKYLFERMGIEWQSVDTSKKNSQISAMKSGSLSHGPSTINTYVPFATKFIRSRRKKNMLEKMKSRKFLMAVATAALVICNDGLGLGLDTETILYVVGIVGVWIFGEAAVDTSRNAKKGKEQTNDFETPIEPRL